LHASASTGRAAHNRRTSEKNGEVDPTIFAAVSDMEFGA
jgi:hypothetical protein